MYRSIQRWLMAVYVWLFMPLAPVVGHNPRRQLKKKIMRDGGMTSRQFVRARRAMNRTFGESSPFRTMPTEIHAPQFSPARAVLVMQIAGILLVLLTAALLYGLTSLL
jgi:hypothetical protein